MALSEQQTQFAKTVADGVKEYVRPIIERVTALEKRLQQLEAVGAKAVRFQPGKQYEVGDQVEHGGQLWRCDAPTSAAPGVTDRWRAVEP